MKIFFSIFLLISSLFALDLSQKTIDIVDVKKDIATIDMGNLKVGQSGIVTQSYSKSESIILNQAVVIESNNASSKIKLLKTDIFNQKAIPTSKKVASKNSKFVLNHLYGTSLLIVPNYESKVEVMKNFSSQYFFNEDNFASFLKLVAKPIPTKKQIQEFCSKNQIGTIFVAIKDKAYILDAISFKVLDSKKIDVASEDVKVPFFSKIEKIEKGFWDFGEDEIKDYNKHYSKVIGL